MNRPLHFLLWTQLYSRHSLYQQNLIESQTLSMKKMKEKRPSAAYTLSYLNYFNQPQFPRCPPKPIAWFENGPGIWNEKNTELNQIHKTLLCICAFNAVNTQNKNYDSKQYTSLNWWIFTIKLMFLRFCDELREGQGTLSHSFESPQRLGWCLPTNRYQHSLSRWKCHSFRLHPAQITTATIYWTPTCPPGILLVNLHIFS